MQQQLNKQKVAIFYNSKSAYSRSFKSEFERTIKPNQIVSVYDFSTKADISIDNLRKAGAEVLVLLPNTEELYKALAVVNKNAKKSKLPVLGGDSFYSPFTLEIGADNAQDMIVSVPWHWETAHKSGSKFTTSSQKLWHGFVSWRTAMSYDATQALIAAIHKKDTREGVAEVLRAKDFSADGASRITFVNGERVQNSQLVKVQRNGKSRSGYDYDFVPVP